MRRKNLEKSNAFNLKAFAIRLQVGILFPVERMAESKRLLLFGKRTVRILPKIFIPALGLFAVASAVVPKTAFAQTDEIQVYDAEIEDQGKFNVRFTATTPPSGGQTPDFPGGIIPDHSVNGAVEWAYGVSRLV